MPSLMLVNPAKRRRNPRTKTRQVKAKRIHRARRAHHNPTSVVAVRRASRRPHVAKYHRRAGVRRRRNPISMGRLTGSNIMKMVKTAAIGGVGAVGVDLIMAQINPMLPPSLMPMPGTPGANDAVRLAVTLGLGKMLAKATRGASETAAIGAMTVQIARLLSPMIEKMSPGTSAAVAGLGYSTPNRIIPGNSRISPNRMGAYTGGRTPLLNGVGAYTQQGGGSPLLSSFTPARMRAGYR